MDNIFKPYIRRHSSFSWGRMGDIELGRGSMGTDMPVLVYRLMEYSLKSVLESRIGRIKTAYSFKEAGRLAGNEFAMNVLHIDQEFIPFFEELKAQMLNLKVGKLNLELFDKENGNIVMSIENDVDCSGVENIHETLCRFDEGFLAGIMDVYSGEFYEFEEIDCWGKGDRICRFEGCIIAN